MRGFTQDNGARHLPEESLAVVHRLPTGNEQQANPIRAGQVDRRARKRSSRVRGNVRIRDTVVGWEARVAEQNHDDGTAVFTSTAGPFSWRLTRTGATHGTLFTLEPDIGEPDGILPEGTDGSPSPPTDSADFVPRDIDEAAPLTFGPRLMLVPELPRLKPEFHPPAQMPLPFSKNQSGPGPGNRSHRQAEGASLTPAGARHPRPGPHRLPPLPPARTTPHTDTGGSVLSPAQLNLFGLPAILRRPSTSRGKVGRGRRGRVLIHADRLADAVQCLAVFMDVSNRLLKH